MKPVKDEELDQLLSGRVKNASDRFDQKAAELVRGRGVDRAPNVFVFPHWMQITAGLAAAIAILFVVTNQKSPEIPIEPVGDLPEIAVTQMPAFEDLFELDAALAPVAVALDPDIFEALSMLSAETF